MGRSSLNCSYKMYESRHVTRGGPACMDHAWSHTLHWYMAGKGLGFRFYREGSPTYIPKRISPITTSYEHNNHSYPKLYPNL